MFFYEWLVPLLLLTGVAIALLYLAVRSKTGCGIRTDGRIVVDKPVESEHPQSPTP